MVDNWRIDTCVFWSVDNDVFSIAGEPGTQSGRADGRSPKMSGKADDFGNNHHRARSKK